MTFTTRLFFIGVVLVMITLILLVLSNRLKDKGKEGLRAAFNAEFLVRPDGYPGLSRHYGFRFPREPMQMDTGLMYRAVADGAVDVICGFATDGRIPAYDLVILKDDKNFFPPYFAAPLVRTKILERFPELPEILGRLENKIDDATMRQLNYRVDNKGEAPAKVARDFLSARGLISEKSSYANGSEGTVVVGSKEFTEQEILGEILAILIENSSDIRVDRKLNLGGTMICFNALKSGDIDLYVEYTGTGLVTILKENVIQDPHETYQVVKEKFSHQYNLTWLSPFGFNNTYTLTMTSDQAISRKISTISDLASSVGEEN